MEWNIVVDLQCTEKTLLNPTYTAAVACEPWLSSVFFVKSSVM